MNVDSEKIRQRMAKEGIPVGTDDPLLLTLGAKQLSSTPTKTSVLALDLSITATGIAHPDGTLTTYHPSTRGDERIVELSHHMSDLLDNHFVVDGRDPLVAIEGPVTRSQAATTIGMVHGAIRFTLLCRYTPYLIVPPALLKKYATGRGNAPKPDLRMALYKRTGQDVADDNQVDAAWLRHLALDLLGQPEIVMPAAQRQVLDKLTLPIGAPA